MGFESNPFLSDSKPVEWKKKLGDFTLVSQSNHANISGSLI